jgi:hypothetical protein
MQSLITPKVVCEEWPMQRSGLTAKLERGRGFSGPMFTAVIERKGKRPIVLVEGSGPELMRVLEETDKLYGAKR